MYVPGTPLQDSVEIPEVPSETVCGESVQVRPVAGDTVSARVTVPVNELRLVTVIDDVPAVPAFTVTLVGLATTLKSGAWLTVYETVAV